MPEVAQAFAFVAELGHDVYLYDQVGGGRSSRLADVREYTVERHVADLEAIRRQLGPGPLTLVGESWGAQLAARYLAAHPVARCILISPGPLYRAEWGASDPCDLKSRASARNRDEFERLLKLRLFAADLLLDVNPSAAHAFLPDAEADAYARRLFSLLLPGTLCEPDRPPPQVDVGLWANIVLERELMRRKVRIDRQLRATRTPFLILRGACDYCRAAVAGQYRDLIPRSRFVAIEGAGHLIWLDQPARFAEALRPFLLAPEPEAPLACQNGRAALVESDAAEPRHKGVDQRQPADRASHRSVQEHDRQTRSAAVEQLQPDAGALNPPARQHHSSLSAPSAPSHAAVVMAHLIFRPEAAKMLMSVVSPHDFEVARHLWPMSTTATSFSPASTNQR